MTTGVAIHARSTGRSAPLVAVVAVVAVLTVVGLSLAILTFTASQPADDPAETADVGHPIETSFGTMTVEHAGNLGGLTSQDLGGVTHGIQNLVLSDKAQVEVAVLLTNAGDAPVLVDPSDFQLLVDGTPDPIAATGSTMRPLSLGPGGSVEAGVTFVVPQTGSHLTFAYTDPGDGDAIRVPIGILGPAPATTDDGHTH